MITNITNLRKLSALFLGAFLSVSAFAKSVDVADFKAVADGKTDNTNAIQKAINACSESGGGEVLFSEKGTYLTASIFIKNNVTLNIPSSVILKGNKKNPEYKKVLINAIDAVNIGIKGFGTIDGAGTEFIIKDCAPGRAELVRISGCKNVNIENITLFNSATWTLHLFKNDNVFINGIRIKSLGNYNNDGIDIQSKNVVISNCIVESDDDALCFKTSDKNALVENVTVTNCILSSNCNFIKFGTESKGGFKNVIISNCVLKRCSESNHRKWHKMKSAKKMGFENTIGGITGIAIETVDGAFIENVAISNIVMTGVQVPIFLRVGHRNKDDRKSIMKDILIQNVIAENESFICNSIAGIPDHELKNVVIKDCMFTMKGGINEENAESIAAAKIPEKENSYPESRMFGTPLPAYGFYLRHTSNVTFDNLQFKYLNDDARHVIFGEDVNGFRILNCLWQKPASNFDLLKFVDCKDVKQFNNMVLAK